MNLDLSHGQRCTEGRYLLSEVQACHCQANTSIYNLHLFIRKQELCKCVCVVKHALMLIACKNFHHNHLNLSIKVERISLKPQANREYACTTGNDPHMPPKLSHKNIIELPNICLPSYMTASNIGKFTESRQPIVITKKARGTITLIRRLKIPPHTWKCSQIQSHTSMEQTEVA